MSEHDTDKKRPTHRVSFARINGRDKDGNNVLGPAREVGAVWPRKDRDGDGILRFDHIPEEMRTRDGGVLFISQIDDRRHDKRESPRTQDRKRRESRDHDLDRDR